MVSGGELGSVCDGDFGGTGPRRTVIRVCGVVSGRDADAEPDGRVSILVAVPTMAT